MFDLIKNDLSKKQEKKINDVTAKLDRTEALLEKFFAEHNLNEEEFHTFFENPDHFHPKTWEELQKASEQLNDQLELDLKCIKNPNSTVQKYKALSSANKWLFVR